MTCCTYLIPGNRLAASIPRLSTPLDDVKASEDLAGNISEKKRG